jgi:hypothetical protein
VPENTVTPTTTVLALFQESDARFVRRQLAAHSVICFYLHTYLLTVFSAQDAKENSRDTVVAFREVANHLA